MLFVAALADGSVLICQVVNKYYRFEVITMTKIKREAYIAFPAISFCSIDNVEEMSVCFPGEKRDGTIVKLAIRRFIIETASE